MGHSLGEYAALIAAGVMPFADALEAAAARGARDDPGRAWTTTAGWPRSWPRYDVVAEHAGRGRRLRRRGEHQQLQPVRDRRREQGRRAGDRSSSSRRATRPSASRSATPSTPRSSPRPARRCARCSTGCTSPPPQPAAGRQRDRRAAIPTTRTRSRTCSSSQIASPVQWVKGLETLYAARRAAPSSRSAPRRRSRALSTTCSATSPTSLSLFTNHPKTGELATLQPGAVRPVCCGLWAEQANRRRATSGRRRSASVHSTVQMTRRLRRMRRAAMAMAMAAHTERRWRRPGRMRMDEPLGADLLAHGSPGRPAAGRTPAARSPSTATRRPLGSVVITRHRAGPARRRQDASWTPTTPCASCAASSSSTCIPERFRKRDAGASASPAW